MIRVEAGDFIDICEEGKPVDSMKVVDISTSLFHAVAYCKKLNGGFEMLVSHPNTSRDGTLAVPSESRVTGVLRRLECHGHCQKTHSTDKSGAA